jgi:retron-type reverse transcriptase
MKILYNEDFLINCYENISKNEGVLTKGTDQTTADKIHLNRIKKLSESLKNDTFKFKPSRRILIPKPGRSVMRPLTIPNFDDRIIQEGIRVILNTIYEPDFERINCNFGFRPRKGTSDAIDFIMTNGKTMNWAIEGDIEKAYDTVNIKKLMSILEKKIKDKKFLKLIEQGLRNGIIFEKIYENTTLGISQGGIARPILFNIYMHEFDKFILQHLENLKNEINTSQTRSSVNKDIRSKIYTRASNSKRKIVDQIKAFTSRMAKPMKYYNLQEKIRILTKRKIKSYKINC